MKAIKYLDRLCAGGTMIPINTGMMESTRRYSDNTIYWHGSPNGKLEGHAGIHIGTHQAAKEALEARIGIPAEGTWDGTREYGKTLLAGSRSIDSGKYGKYRKSGYNVDAPDEDYYPVDQTKARARYSDGTPIPFDATPNIFKVKISGQVMTNTPTSPHEDYKANGYIKAQLKKGRAVSGYYYTNVGEDAGSISAVVPDSSFLIRI
jgi:hypothetical protein